MKKVRARKCFYCKKVKFTTNLDNPYFCEECLKEDGRVSLLGENKGSMLLIFFFGIVIGVVLVKLLDIFF